MACPLRLRWWSLDLRGKLAVVLAVTIVFRVVTETVMLDQYVLTKNPVSELLLIRASGSLLDVPPAREPSRDLPCDAEVPIGTSGFCEYRHRTTSDVRRRVLSFHCNTLRHSVVLQCQDAAEYVAFGQRALQYVHDPTLAYGRQRELLLANGLSLTAQVPFTRGVVMVVYDAALVSAYASVRVLRDSGCVLPIELWYDANETSADHPVLRELLTMASVFCRDIHDPRATKYFTKLHAVYYSAFDSVLLLDTDTFAVRDPTFLFESPAFRESGAVFWPDFWRPNQTIFHIHEQNLLWQVFGIPFLDSFEQESGQVLIDRVRHKTALETLMIQDELRLVWGDKDLFRLAWMKTHSSFHYIARPPGSAGRLHRQKNQFCGLSMVQYDPHGEILFLHRNTVKLDAVLASQRLLWTHIQQFRPGAPLAMYDIVRARFILDDIPKCWGKPDAFPEFYAVEPIEGFAYASLELKLLQFAEEAIAIAQAVAS